MLSTFDDLAQPWPSLLTAPAHALLFPDRPFGFRFKSAELLVLQSRFETRSSQFARVTERLQVLLNWLNAHGLLGPVSADDLVYDLDVMECVPEKGIVYRFASTYPVRATLGVTEFVKYGQFHWFYSYLMGERLHVVEPASVTPEEFPFCANGSDLIETTVRPAVRALDL